MNQEQSNLKEVSSYLEQSLQGWMVHRVPVGNTYTGLCLSSSFSFKLNTHFSMSHPGDNILFY